MLLLPNQSTAGISKFPEKKRIKENGEEGMNKWWICRGHLLGGAVLKRGFRLCCVHEDSLRFQRDV